MEQPHILRNFLHQPQPLRHKLMTLLKHLQLIEYIPKNILNNLHIFKLASPIDRLLHCRHKAFLLMLTNRYRKVVFDIFELAIEYFELIEMREGIGKRQKC
jgi:hypothetical protein